MATKAISVTLASDNVTWLEARAGASGGNVSELLDRIVTSARTGGGVVPARSVAATIGIDPSDPLLERADGFVRSMFGESVERPIVRQEPRSRYGARKGTPRARRG